MTPSGMKIHAPFVCSLALLAAACGPTRPPPDLLGTAEQRLADARSAGAATFAPLELRFAEERLDQARAAMQKRDYTATTNLADESEANSALAGIKARLGKLRESVDALRKDNNEIRRVLGPDADAGGEAR
ncbi:MAG: DUF4398 domain-containing protein [Dokdonella sp.]|uniref:DUF4398 domain-containing protein n=1 Tax=Dokdonella sp. TaxID=2291710 RepID=UPI002BEC36EB|nr:DUF4398 domain-containing protein [Dokdonella sp.]HOX72091.1 DUF4398 domain-containing protein [Dokdonella sp.]